MSYKTYTKDKLISLIKGLETENDRLTKERNNSINALANWKRLNDLDVDDGLDEMTIKIIKQIMKITDKVRTRL